MFLSGGYQADQKHPNEETMFLFKKRNTGRKADAAPVGFVDFQRVPLKNILKVKDGLDNERGFQSSKFHHEDKETSRSKSPIKEKIQQDEGIKRSSTKSDSGLRALVKGNQLPKPLFHSADQTDVLSTMRTSKRRLRNSDTDLMSDLRMPQQMGRKGRRSDPKVANPRRTLEPLSLKEKRLHQTA